MAFRRGTRGPTNIILPTMRGIGQIGQTLTADPGTWTGSPSFAYQWVRDDLTVLSTATTYVPVTADFGHFLTLNVTATANGKSTVASSLLPQYSMFSVNLDGSNVKRLYTLPSQECNHGHQNSTGTHVAFSVYNQYSGSSATEGVSYLGTEIRSVRLSDGLVEVLVTPDVNFNNSNPQWSPSGDFFIYATTKTPSTRGGVGKYIIGTHTNSVFFDPGTPKVADFDIGVDGSILMGGDDTVSGQVISIIYVFTGGVLTPLTQPFTTLQFNPRGDADPHWSHDQTMACCIRALTPQKFKIVIVTMGPGHTLASEAIIEPFGSVSSFYGVPEFSSNDELIVSWYTDPADRSSNGIYYQTPTGTGRTRVPLPVGYNWNTVSFIPGGGSGPSAGIIVSGQPLPIYPQVPVNTVVPAVTGTTTLGQVLTTTNGTWTSTGTPVFSRQWERDGAAIASATGTTYTLVSSDIGALIDCAVTATNSGGNGLAYSNMVGPVVSTTTFFVANAGNDSNAGTTSGSPWQTVAKVNAQSFAAGTSVLFNRGDIWREQLSPTASGSAGNPIVFDAYGTGAAPILQGSVAASTTGDWTLISGNLWKSTTVFPPAAQATITVTIASPGVVTWTAHGQANGQAVAFSTTGALPTGITAGVGYYVVNKATNTFEISLTPGGAPINTSGSQSGVHSGGFNGYPHNNSNDIGNLIWNSGGVTRAGKTSYILMTGQDDANLINQGDYYFNTTDWKVHVYSFGNPATAMTGLELAVDKVVAYFNNKSNITIQNMILQYGAGSGLMFHQASNMIARDLTISWCGGGNDGGKDLRAGNGADIQLVSSNCLIERCLIQQCYDCGLTIQPLVSDQPISDITFRNNIITNATQGLVQIISSGATITNVSVYNNTGYNTPSWSENQRWGAGGTDESGERFGLYHSDSGGSTMTNYNNFNNVYAGLGSSCSIRHPIPATTWQGSGNMLLDYNLWSRSDTTSPIVCVVPAGGNPLLTTWAAGDTPPQEVHGVVGVNPKFSDPDLGDFSPYLLSPMLNAGVNLYSSGVVLDFDKQARPSAGAFTLGAIQNSAVVETTPINFLAPAIRGTGQVGQVVNCDMGIWAGNPTSFAYQLLRNATPISGASGTTADKDFVFNYTCVTADHGQNVFMQVTASNSAGSAIATTTLPQFAIYRSTLTGSDLRLAYSLPTQELNHANTSPILPDGSRLIALTTYDKFQTNPPFNPPLFATEAQGSLDTEIRLLDPLTGSAPSVVPPNVLYQHAWPNWIQDGSGFIFTTTEGTTGGKQAIGKYVISPPATSLFYDPGDISITSSHMNSNGDVVMAGTTPITGGFQGFLYVKPNGGARVQLTNPTIAVNPAVLGDSAPSFSPDGKSVVCLRQLTPGKFNIVVITLGAAFTNAGETVIAVPGGATATDGIPRWADNSDLIITYHIDPSDVATSGIYTMLPDGTGRVKLNLLTQSRLSLVEFVPGTGSTPFAQILWSAQLFPIFGAKPVNTVLTTISGTAKVGSTLTATPGTWQNSPSLTRQWKLAGVAISGATGLTYVPVSGDIGSTITVSETATNDGGIVTVTSAATAAVIP